MAKQQQAMKTRGYLYDGGEARPFDLEVGAPRKFGKEWVCAVRFPLKLGDEVLDVFGANEAQAATLALDFVGRLMDTVPAFGDDGEPLELRLGKARRVLDGRPYPRLMLNAPEAAGQTLTVGGGFPVGMLLGLMAEGVRDRELFKAVPGLTDADVRDALRYAQDSVVAVDTERFMNAPQEPRPVEAAAERKPARKKAGTKPKSKA